VELEIDGHHARTDRTGRFLLTLDGVATGRHVLDINGATANRAGRTYGFFEAGVQIVAGKTTALPFTIWMPAIDTAHAVTIPSPTTQETVITTPYIPGLELHLAAGTVIRDEDGDRVTRVSLTPIPVDRTPFPLPAGVEVPIYFTIQPGGAYIGAYGSTSKAARLYYPNYTAQPAGTRMDFWHYDPDDRGWYVYGQGGVEPSGRQVIPDPGIGIYEFTGAMISTGGAPGTWPSLGGLFGGDPVDLATGLFVMHKTDLLLRDVLPIVLNRTYRPNDSTSRSFGIGSTQLYDLRLWRPSLDNYDDVALILPDGARIEYDRIDGGTGFVDLVLEHTSSPTAFYKSRITWNGNGFDLAMKDGTVLVFGDNAPLQSIRDRFGNTITLVRTTGQTGKIDRIISPNGRWISLSYDASQRITQATDNIGRTVTYTYDSGRLWKVTDAAGGITEYTYDSSHRMLTIKDARGITYLTNTYDSNGRVATQTQADTGVFEFDYTLDGSGKVTQTDVTDPRGYVQRYTFNSGEYHLTLTEALGTALERTTTLVRASPSHRITSLTDPLDRETTYAYASYGNVTTVTRLAGTADAVTTTFTYEPAYQQVASVTDPLSHTTTFTYDYAGHLTSMSDALSHQTTFTYNPSGQPLTMTNGASETVTFGYVGGDLVSITSPLGNVTTLLTDGAGRVIQVSDPSGRSTRAVYDALDLVTSIVDALSNTTSFTYDANGNLLTLTDARSKTTTWTYDDMDRVATRIDPLTRAESFAYDLNGNLTSWTDRKER
jgi:YD repeat-containing protein